MTKHLNKTNYETILLDWNKETNKTSIKWSDLQLLLDIEDYPYFANKINELVDLNILVKKGSKKNGRTPALFEKYKIIFEEKDYSHYIDEIDYELAPEFNKTYYRQKLNLYERDRDDILAISDYIKKNRDILNTTISINERSFDVFRKEKYIKTKGLNSILKNLGLPADFFNYYETCEPIAYYSVSKSSPQNILIIENKDTFYSIRKYIKSISKNVLGIEISTVIYGAGNGRLPSIDEINEYTDDYISDRNNKFYYFGDIDYAGIFIYENYRKRNEGKIELLPFKPGYNYIVNKTVKDDLTIETLPITKEGQKDNMKGIFMNLFDPCVQKKMEDVLSKRRYIPQEALNFYDLISHKEE